ncbi:MAG: methionine adenosyltransferase [Bacilli bacterium]|nr:methionine adenosyltransferase [Bacilli bacterium]
MKKLFTSESVTEGHPDKLCDYISDSILDAYLELDPNSRVGCEVVAGKNKVFVTGEITSNGEVDIESIVRKAIKDIGYFGDTDIDYKKCEVIVNTSKQSSDIAMGTNDTVGGAGDQGMMFGYACDDNEDYMPMAIYLAHKLTKRLTEVRKENIIAGIGADGKSQVTLEYDNDSIKRVETIVISVQHKDSKDLDELKKEIKKEVIDYVIPKNLIDKKTNIYINPTGRFVIGGPLGDSGLTGRKIIVDTYGGYARHGGGAFSGKDATKVDRSASYMARHIAKNIVANGYAKRCEIQIAYAIGIAKPVSVNINTFGTNTIPEEEIVDKVLDKFDLTPQGIIKYLDLRKPIYKQTTNYGHFGKKDLTWERIIKF